MSNGFLFFRDLERLDRKPDLPAGLSIWVTTASTMSPAAKRSGRCSLRSRERSARRMNAVTSVPEIFTSMPASFTSTTSQVTVAALLESGGRLDGIGRELLDAEADALLLGIGLKHLTARTVSPFLYSLIASSPGRCQSRSDRCTIPSISPSRPTNRPNSVMFLTSPSTIEPFGWLSAKAVPGILLGLLEAQRDAPFCRIDFENLNLTSWLVETILPGWTFFLIQLISETWMSPSTPGSSSTKAP